MTDDLIRLPDSSGGSSDGLLAIGTRYSNVAASLVSGDELDRLLADWRADAEAIEALLRPASGHDATHEQRNRDIVAGYGEIWSARLLAAHLEERLGRERAGTWLDARRLITVRHGELGPSVQWDASRRNWSGLVPPEFTGIAVITGYIASDEQGMQTTLGRNGSDFSASIVAALAGADELTIWTDVDGVMSADPNRVP
jgi:aspartokinase/homoserine dehydrogenase 1